LDIPVALHPLLAREPLALRLVDGDAVPSPPYLGGAETGCRADGGADVMGVPGVDEPDRRRAAARGGVLPPDGRRVRLAQVDLDGIPVLHFAASGPFVIFQSTLPLSS